MRELKAKGPSFDLGDFRTRAKRVQRRMNRSYATLSKRLFTSARMLPDLMDRSRPDDARKFPGLHHLLLADKRLKALEQALENGAAGPSPATSSRKGRRGHAEGTSLDIEGT